MCVCGWNERLISIFSENVLGPLGFLKKQLIFTTFSCALLTFSNTVYLHTQEFLVFPIVLFLILLYHTSQAIYIYTGKFAVLVGLRQQWQGIKGSVVAFHTPSFLEISRSREIGHLFFRYIKVSHNQQGLVLVVSPTLLLNSKKHLWSLIKQGVNR